VNVRRSTRWFALVAFAAALLGAAPRALDFGFTPAGGPFVRTPVAGTGLRSADCAVCHAEVAAEWRGSMHARSFLDPVFRAEFDGTRDTTSCRSCHSPLAALDTPEPTLAEEGIGCTACHVRDGEVLSARAPSAHSPHPIRVAPELGSPEFCAGCHEFRFPSFGRADGPPYDPSALQQSTHSEWRASPAASTHTCNDCHMPNVTRASGATGRVHRVRSLEDRPFVESALEVAAEIDRTARRTRVRIRLTVREAGHAVPTGDIFRVLVITVDSAEGTAHRELRRNFAERWTPGGWVLDDSYDDRVMPGVPKSVTLELPPGRGAVRYRVELHRLAPESARHRGFPESLVVIPVASGVLAPAR
jgi:hypothetical protein